MKYLVIMVHNFENDTPAYEFQEWEYEKAKEYLQKMWEDYYNTEIAEGSWLDESRCYHEDEYAVVTWVDGCRTEFILTFTSKPDKRYL